MISSRIYWSILFAIIAGFILLGVVTGASADTMKPSVGDVVDVHFVCRQPSTIKEIFGQPNEEKTVEVANEMLSVVQCIKLTEPIKLFVVEVVRPDITDWEGDVITIIGVSPDPGRVPMMYSFTLIQAKGA